MRELDVIGVRMEMPLNAPVLLLSEVGGRRYLPIWIGTAEAAAIASSLDGITPIRPMTHDLFVDSIRALGHELTSVAIVGLEGGTFYAELHLGPITVSARPSDAIALAVRVGAKITCAEHVLDDAGVEMAQESEEEVEKFREFLDTINPDDFDAPAGH